MSRDRRIEFVVAVALALGTAIGVMLARDAGSPIGATFLAGVGAGAAATYVAMTNAVIARGKQRR
jgi:hypothetical protein